MVSKHVTLIWWNLQIKGFETLHLTCCSREMDKKKLDILSLLRQCAGELSSLTVTEVPETFVHMTCYFQAKTLLPPGYMAILSGHALFQRRYFQIFTNAVGKTALLQCTLKAWWMEHAGVCMGWKEEYSLRCTVFLISSNYTLEITFNGLRTTCLPFMSA